MSLISVFVFVLTILIAPTLILSSSSDDRIAQQRYEDWILKQGKIYPNDVEKAKRFEIFKKNLQFVEEFNSRKNNNATYTLKLNDFADLSYDEFLRTRTGFHNISSFGKTQTVPVSVSSNQSLAQAPAPASIDWRDHGAVTPVKDQQTCGACWAFAVVGAIEGIVGIKTGSLTQLSEQQLIDCDISNGGCQGGQLGQAFEHIIDSEGLATQANYPYQSAKGDCRVIDPSEPLVHISSFLPVYDEKMLFDAVSQQPVAAALEASPEFKAYGGGIFNTGCGINLNHAVTVVGYGTSEDGVDYWLLKNSWGPNWGENGYMRLQRNLNYPNGLCGIVISAFYAIY